MAGTSRGSAPDPGGRLLCPHALVLPPAPWLGQVEQRRPLLCGPVPTPLCPRSTVHPLRDGPHFFPGVSCSQKPGVGGCGLMRGRWAVVRARPGLGVPQGAPDPAARGPEGERRQADSMGKQQSGFFSFLPSVYYPRSVCVRKTPDKGSILQTEAQTHGHAAGSGPGMRRLGCGLASRRGASLSGGRGV